MVPQTTNSYDKAKPTFSDLPGTFFLELSHLMADRKLHRSLASLNETSKGLRGMTLGGLWRTLVVKKDCDIIMVKQNKQVMDLVREVWIANEHYYFRESDFPNAQSIVWVWDMGSHDPELHSTYSVTVHNFISPSNLPLSELIRGAKDHLVIRIAPKAMNGVKHHLDNQTPDFFLGTRIETLVLTCTPSTDKCAFLRVMGRIAASVMESVWISTDDCCDLEQWYNQTEMSDIHEALVSYTNISSFYYQARVSYDHTEGDFDTTADYVPNHDFLRASAVKASIAAPLLRRIEIALRYYPSPDTVTEVEYEWSVEVRDWEGGDIPGGPTVSGNGPSGPLIPQS